jgi:hypothetical protein
MAGIPYEESQPRYEEAQDIIMKALTEERFSHHGALYTVNDVTVYPRPVQKTMPVYLTGTSGRSFRFAAERGWGISVGGPAPYPVFAKAIAEYRDACIKAGTKPIVSWIQPVHIAPTENEAHEQARLAAPYFYHQIAKPILSVDQKGDRDRLLAAGYGFYASDAMNQMLTLTYDDIYGKKHINQDILRYELHRVWVIDSQLKPGFRHLYKRHVAYFDEDTWMGVAYEAYDAKDRLWRVGEQYNLNLYDKRIVRIMGDSQIDLINGRYTTFPYWHVQAGEASGFGMPKFETTDEVSVDLSVYTPQGLRKFGTR